MDEHSDKLKLEDILSSLYYRRKRFYPPLFYTVKTQNPEYWDQVVKTSSLRSPDSRLELHTISEATSTHLITNNNEELQFQDVLPMGLVNVFPLKKDEQINEYKTKILRYAIQLDSVYDNYFTTNYIYDRIQEYFSLDPTKSRMISVDANDNLADHALPRPYIEKYNPAKNTNKHSSYMDKDQIKLNVNPVARWKTKYEKSMLYRAKCSFLIFEEEKYVVYYRDRTKDMNATTHASKLIGPQILYAVVAAMVYYNVHNQSTKLTCSTINNGFDLLADVTYTDMSSVTSENIANEYRNGNIGPILKYGVRTNIFDNFTPSMVAIFFATQNAANNAFPVEWGAFKETIVDQDVKGAETRWSEIIAGWWASSMGSNADTPKKKTTDYGYPLSVMEFARHVATKAGIEIKVPEEKHLIYRDKNTNLYFSDVKNLADIAWEITRSLKGQHLIDGFKWKLEKANLLKEFNNLIGVHNIITASQNRATQFNISLAMLFFSVIGYIQPKLPKSSPFNFYMATQIITALLFAVKVGYYVYDNNDIYKGNPLPFLNDMLFQRLLDSTNYLLYAPLEFAEPLLGRDHSITFANVLKSPHIHEMTSLSVYSSLLISAPHFIIYICELISSFVGPFLEYAKKAQGAVLEGSRNTVWVFLCVIKAATQQLFQMYNGLISTHLVLYMLTDIIKKTEMFGFKTNLDFYHVLATITWTYSIFQIFMTYNELRPCHFLMAKAYTSCMSENTPPVYDVIPGTIKINGLIITNVTAENASLIGPMISLGKTGYHKLPNKSYINLDALDQLNGDTNTNGKWEKLRKNEEKRAWDDAHSYATLTLAASITASIAYAAYTYLPDLYDGLSNLHENLIPPPKPIIDGTLLASRGNSDKIDIAYQNVQIQGILDAMEQRWGEFGIQKITVLAIVIFASKKLVVDPGCYILTTAFNSIKYIAATIWWGLHNVLKRMLYYSLLKPIYIWNIQSCIGATTEYTRSLSENEREDLQKFVSNKLAQEDPQLEAAIREATDNLDKNSIDAFAKLIEYVKYNEQVNTILECTPESLHNDLQTAREPLLKYIKEHINKDTQKSFIEYLAEETGLKKDKLQQIQNSDTTDDVFLIIEKDDKLILLHQSINDWFQTSFLDNSCKLFLNRFTRRKRTPTQKKNDVIGFYTTCLHLADNQKEDVEKIRSTMWGTLNILCKTYETLPQLRQISKENLMVALRDALNLAYHRPVKNLNLQKTFKEDNLPSINDMDHVTFMTLYAKFVQLLLPGTKPVDHILAPDEVKRRIINLKDKMKQERILVPKAPIVPTPAPTNYF